MIKVKPSDDLDSFCIADAKLSVIPLNNLVRRNGPIHVYGRGADIDCEPTIGDLVMVTSPLGSVWLTLIDIRPEGDLIGVVYELEADSRIPDIEAHSLVKLPGLSYVSAVKYC